MRHFGIVFDGGFALANEEWQIANVASQHSNVEIKEYPTREQAYFYTAYKLIDREYWRAPYRQLPLPKIEDMCNGNWVFYAPEYVGCFNPRIIKVVVISVPLQGRDTIQMMLWISFYSFQNMAYWRF